MSIYRKDNDGNIKKIAGLFIKTYNTKWFNVTRSVENGLEIYTLNNEDLDYFEYIQTRSIFNLNFTEPNTTTTPKLRIGNKVFDIYSLINSAGEIPIGILSSIVQFYFGATLELARVYINDYLLLKVYNTQNDLDAVIDNTKLISTESGGFKAGKDIITEEDGVGIGNNIEANYLKCITIGQNLNNSGEKSLIIGNDSNNNAEECILIGNNNQADNYSAIVIGNNGSAKQNGIAIGDNAHADNNAVQLGTGNNTEPNSLQFRTLKVIDGNGNLYENNIKLSELYARKTFLQNLYLSRTGALTANIVSERPTVSSINYMTMSTTNTQLDYNSATKLTLSRVLQSSIQLTNDLEILVKLSFALNRNAQLEFGGRVLVDGVPISDNQAFGLNSYEGDSSYTGVVDTEFGIKLNLINEVQEFQAGQTLTVELFTRQVSNSTLVTRYYCGINIGGVDRHSFIDINTISTSLDTNNIEDGAITTPKIANSAITHEKLSTDILTTLNEVANLVDGTTLAGDSSKLGGVDAASYAQLSQVVRTDATQTLTDGQKQQARENINSLPEINKTLPSLSNTNVTSTTIQEFVQSFNLKYGEGTKAMYFENGDNYSTILGFLDKIGIIYKQYNYLSVLRVDSNAWIVTVYAGYNNQVQMTIPPQYFFVTQSGASPATSNYALKSEVVKLSTTTNVTTNKEEWGISAAGGAGTYLIGTFKVYDTNIHLRVTGGSGSNIITDIDILINCTNYAIDKAVCYANTLYTSSALTGVYCTLDSSHNLRIYIASPNYGKFFVSASVVGGTIVDKGSPSTQSPSNGFYISTKYYLSLDPTALDPTVEENKYSVGTISTSITTSGTYDFVLGDSITGYVHKTVTIDNGTYSVTFEKYGGSGSSKMLTETVLCSVNGSITAFLRISGTSSLLDTVSFYYKKL